MARRRARRNPRVRVKGYTKVVHGRRIHVKGYMRRR